jgi:ribosomal-protein-alanine N-acetyltransferase
MPTLTLQPLSLFDLDDLQEFEFENRHFFESHINARPVAYYTDGGVHAAIKSAMEDAQNDRAYQFLVRDELGKLVARFNLNHIRRTYFHSAELGYRVSEAMGGKGYASEAVKLVLVEAFTKLKLLRVEATARPGNMGSVKVLQRNGFTQYGKSNQSFQLGEQWFDLLHFEIRTNNVD